jgi:hypothetical protein
MSSPVERHPATGRNLNPRGNTAYPHCHRFPGLGAMTRQRHFNAQSYRNRRRCAAGELPARFAPKAHPPLAEIPVQLHTSLNPAEVSPRRNSGLCGGGITTSVTISASLLWLLFPLFRIPPRSGIQERDFGGAKFRPLNPAPKRNPRAGKVTDALVAQSCCVVVQRADRFFSRGERSCNAMPNIRTSVSVY